MIEKKLKSINPKNNITLRSWDIPSLNDINIIIENSSGSMSWSELDLISRKLLKLSKILHKRSKEMSNLMAEEMGKPERQGMTK